MMILRISPLSLSWSRTQRRTALPPTPQATSPVLWSSSSSGSVVTEWISANLLITNHLIFQTASWIFHVPHVHPNLSDCHDVLDFFLDQAWGIFHVSLSSLWWSPLTLSSWSQAVPARVTLGVTSLLTLSTQHANSQKSLPPVSYIKVPAIIGLVSCLTMSMSVISYMPENKNSRCLSYSA